MGRELVGFKPELNASHDYAVGVKVAGGKIFAPLQTYATREELERAYRSWYNSAKISGLSLPMAVEKLDRGAKWDDSRCVSLPDIMQKIIDESTGSRN